MKRLFSLLFVLSCTLSTFADVITKERAQQYVIDKVIPMINPVAEIGEVTPVFHDNCLVYYVLNLQPEGWALVSATDAVRPLLGYNPTGRYELKPEMDNNNAWMRGYVHEIVKAVEEKDAPIRDWDKLPTSPVTRAAGKRIDPLISVTWNQGSPYNKYCPSDANGRAVVGCVAVAMAQAMSVAKYPSRPIGEFSYAHNVYGSLYINYDEEAAYNWNAIINGDNGKDDVAKLLYHCGVSVKMDYSPGGSGTQSTYVPGALKRNFAYPDAVTYYSRSSYSGDWEQLVIDELEAGRAVYYSGHDPIKNYGHAFNLDGYDGNSMFHVNWGWGGVNNGYFTIDGLRDKKMDMDYTAGHGVVVNIRKPSSAPTDINLATTRVAADAEVGTVVTAIEITSEMEDATYSYKITGPYNYITKRYGKVPFAIDDAGNLVTTEALTANVDYDVIITVTNTKTNESFKKEFVIKVVDDTAVEYVVDEIYSLELDGNTLTITVGAKGSMTVYSLQGGCMLQSSLAAGDNSINVHTNGVYIVEVVLNGAVYIQKIHIK